MSFRSGYKGSPQFEAWLDEYVPIEPLIKEPLDIHGGQARRRTLVQVLLRELKLDHRLDYEGANLRPETYEVLFDMIERLADVRSRRHVHAPTQAREICGMRAGAQQFDGIDRVKALAVVLDLGWSHLPVYGESARDAADGMVVIYAEQMGSRVLAMLRRWQHEDWLPGEAA